MAKREITSDPVAISTSCRYLKMQQTAILRQLLSKNHESLHAIGHLSLAALNPGNWIALHSASHFIICIAAAILSRSETRKIKFITRFELNH